MSEELQSMIQIMELYGRGLGALGRGIRFTAKGVKSGLDYAQVKQMQYKIKLHYASVGKHKTMKLSELEKITGDQYHILNILLEDEDKLLDFYDHLKKMRVSFAELPDLMIGDGFTQIAYNPMDAEKVRTVVDLYRKKLSSEPRDISVDEYIKTADEDGLELLDKLAEKGYREEQHIEQLENIQERIKNPDYFTVTMNVESLLIEERRDEYVMRMPRGRTGAALEHAFIIAKSDVLLMDDGKTLITPVKQTDKIPQYHLDSKNNVLMDYPLVMSGDDFCKAFSPVGADRKKAIGKLKPTQIDIFPNFNKGVGEGAGHLPPEVTIASIMTMEKAKELQRNPDYISMQFDVETQLVFEKGNHYIVALPNEDTQMEELQCLVLEKADVYMSADEKEIHAFLKKKEVSTVELYKLNGQKTKELLLENEKILEELVKKEAGILKKEKIHIPKVDKHIPLKK